MSNLEKLHNKELEIVKKIIEICNKHNIKYYILGGTLLGAVRHKGFIPWDDDIDIGMPREDYEKFINIAKEELPKKLFLDYFKDNKNNPEYYSYYMARIVDNSVSVVTKTAKKERDIGAWVDIFPIDGLPNNKLICFFHKFRLLYLRAKLRFSQFSGLVTVDYSKKDFLMRCAIRFGNIINLEKMINKDKCLEQIDNILKKYDYKKSINIINFAGACKSYKFIEIFPKEKYEDLIEYNFENISLIGPKDYDFILSHQYGEYMKEPVDKNKHSTEVVDDNEKN